MISHHTTISAFTLWEKERKIHILKWWVFPLYNRLIYEVSELHKLFLFIVQLRSSIAACSDPILTPCNVNT